MVLYFPWTLRQAFDTVGDLETNFFVGRCPSGSIGRGNVSARVGAMRESAEEDGPRVVTSYQDTREAHPFAYRLGTERV